MSLTALDLAAAGGATLVAGVVNALAGGGTLVSFPALVAIGVPSLPANITNTVALCPGYLSGSVAQREDLRGQGARVRWLSSVAGLGGLAGSALLEVTPQSTFSAVVPYLLILSCLLLAAGDRVRAWVRARTARSDGDRPVTPGPASAGPASAAQAVQARPSTALMVAVFLSAIYGGFFGAGLGIMTLAVLGLWLEDSVVRLNAVKQVLSLVINVLAAVFFAFSGHVRWELVPVMAVAGLLGGTFGGRLARVINPTWLRRVVIVFGLAVAIEFWVRG